MSTPIRSADELCAAIETVLVDHLDDTMNELGWTNEAGYESMRSWRQLPSLDALTAAQLPAGAVIAPDVVGEPVYEASTGLWRTTWRIPVVAYGRGSDHSDTQARIRNRVAAIRTTLLAHKSLGGLASAMRWTGENHNLIPARDSARSIAAGGISVDVTADVDMSLGTLPVVETTFPTVTVIKTGTSVSVR